MADVDLVKTGIAELDSILNGGIPRGNVIAVEGRLAAGRRRLGWSSFTAALPNSTSPA